MTLNFYDLDTEFCAAFGNQVRKLKKSKGFGLREFCSNIDIEYSQLWKKENGEQNPTLSTVIYLAK